MSVSWTTARTAAQAIIPSRARRRHHEMAMARTMRMPEHASPTIEMWPFTCSRDHVRAGGGGPAVVEADHVVGQAAALGLVVGHPDHRAPPVGQRPHEPFEQRDVGGVERRRRLVHQQHLRLGHQRPGQAGPLALAAGEDLGVALEEVDGQADAFQGDLGVSGREVRAGDAQVVEHGPVEQRRALEHHADAPPQPEWVEVGDVVASEAHRPARRELEAVAEAQGGRLAGAGRAGQDRDALGRDRGGEPREDRGGAGAHDHGVEVEQRHGHVREATGPVLRCPLVKVPLTVVDHLRRAEQVYGQRVGGVDEPSQPAEAWGEVTYAEMARRARAQAAGLGALGLEVGDRVAVVSHNSAGLLTSFFGVSGFGRILVPINFRLNADEVGYIVEHSGARVLLIDPELDDALSGVKTEHRFVIGAAADEELLRYDAEPRAWAGDEDATATINYTSGTTARPKGVQLTHRNCWLNATQFGWHMGVSDRDVYLHTLPMFHANGWGMPFAVTGMGGRHIVLRKVDGAEILRRVAAHGVTLMCGAPAVAAAVLEAAATWGGPVPGVGTVRMVVAGAPPPTRTIERLEAELGWEFVQVYGLTETAPILTMTRGRSEWDDMTPADRARKLGRAGAPVLGVEVATAADGEVLARSNVVMEGYW